MGAETAVRRADPADAGAIARIHVAAWRLAYREFLPPETLARLSTRDRKRYWREALGSGTGRYLTLVAERAGVLLGFSTIAMRSTAGHEAEITAIYVDPPNWRQGVGTVLLAASLEQARAADADTAVLWVFERNRPAQELYKDFGFAADGETMHHDSGQIALRMSAALDCHPA